MTVYKGVYTLIVVAEWQDHYQITPLLKEIGDRKEAIEKHVLVALKELFCYPMTVLCFCIDEETQKIVLIAECPQGAQSEIDKDALKEIELKVEEVVTLPLGRFMGIPLSAVRTMINYAPYNGTFQTS